MLLVCVLAASIWLVQAVALFYFAVARVQGRYTNLGFVNGGGGQGDVEAFRMWGLLLLLVTVAEVVVVLAVIGRRHRYRGHHQR